VLSGGPRGRIDRWISLGPFNLQPSEFGRIALALILAMYFGENRRGARNNGDLIIAGLFFLVPFVLIAKQPDLGTAVTLVPVASASRTSPAAAAAHRDCRDAAVLLAPVRGSRAQGLSEIAHQHVPGSGEGRARRGYQQIQARITVGSGG
jgi:rod shape determining protein RodA